MHSAMNARWLSSVCITLRRPQGWYGGVEGPSSGGNASHAQQGRSMHWAELEPCERITAVSYATNPDDSLAMLGFHTSNSRTLGPFGDASAAWITLAPPTKDGYLIALKGFATTPATSSPAKVFRLRLVWGSHETASHQPISSPFRCIKTLPWLVAQSHDGDAQCGSLDGKSCMDFDDIRAHTGVSCEQAIERYAPILEGVLVPLTCGTPALPQADALEW